MKWCTPTRSSHNNNNNNLRVCKAEVGAGSESRPRHSLRHRVAGKHPVRIANITNINDLLPRQIMHIRHLRRHRRR